MRNKETDDRKTERVNCQKGTKDTKDVKDIKD
jgi:hypothetical protein